MTTTYRSSLRSFLLILSLLAAGCSRVGASPKTPERRAVEPDPTPEPSPEPVRFGERGRIVFIGEDGNLYTISPKGEDLRAVTEDAIPNPAMDEPLRRYHAPTWAPVTRDLAYIRVRDTAVGRVTTVEVSRLGTEKGEIVFQQSSEAPFYLYWSPNGEALTFLSNHEEREGITLRMIEGGGEARLLDQGQPYYWDWTPEGDRILAHVGGSSEANPDGARLSMPLDQVDPWADSTLELLRFQAPAISPDGESVLLAANHGDEPGGLVLMGLRGGVEARLAQLEGSVAFDWSASGRHIAYVTSSEPSGALFGDLTVLNVENSPQPIEVEFEAEGVTAFMWSPIHERLAYFVPSLPPSGQDRRISNSLQQQELYLNLFIFDVDKEEPQLLATFLPTTAFLETLPFYDQFARSTTFWSPDGESMVYSGALPSGSASIYVADVSGPSSPVEIARGTLAYWSME